MEALGLGVPTSEALVPISSMFQRTVLLVWKLLAICLLFPTARMDVRGRLRWQQLNYIQQAQTSKVSVPGSLLPAPFSCARLSLGND